MPAILRLTGLALIVCWLVVLVSRLAGVEVAFLAAGRHFQVGLVLVMAVLFVEVLPYFLLVGTSARLKALDSRSGEAIRRLNHVIGLKAGLLGGTIASILVTLALPVLGFLESGARVPRHSHLVAAIVVLVVFARHWARSLFALRMAGDLCELQFDGEAG